MSFNCYCQSLILKGRLDTGLKSFGNLLSNLYTEFTILDIKYYYTSGELNFHRNELSCKNITSLIVGAKSGKLK